MRRLIPLSAIPLLLSVAACSAGGPDLTAHPDVPLPMVTTGKAFGEEPTLDRGKGDPPKKLMTTVLSKGSGPVLAKGDPFEVNYIAQEWTKDKPYENTYDVKIPFSETIGTGDLIAGWDQGLVGQKVGSRIEMVIPPELGYGEMGQAGVSEGATLVFVIDIVKGAAVPSSAKGTKVAKDDPGLPTVGTNTDGKEPDLEVPRTREAPKHLLSKYVLEGDGPVVRKTDTAVVNLVGRVWVTNAEFDSSYDRGKVRVMPLSQVTIKGMTDGLVGKKVGSRVLLVIPPGQALGDGESPLIPKNSTLVFSIDILATM
ncbi:FKBP-type peptidyl-prolyl cis-trans isomerase [Streptomyces sp. NBC_00459]|uniref:FKBP-type peptidyl-prolyl cis-trans isomerase n=1 Tax=Streptomyces sp. NBC_00459 TaxID=2975749 RepID=UPI002E19A052